MCSSSAKLGYDVGVVGEESKAAEEDANAPPKNPQYRGLGKSHIWIEVPRLGSGSGSGRVLLLCLESKPKRQEIVDCDT